MPGLRGACQVVDSRWDTSYGEGLMDCEVRRSGGQADLQRACPDPGPVQDDLSHEDLLHPARGGSVVSCCQGASAVMRREHVWSQQLYFREELTNSSQSSIPSGGLRPSPSSSTPSPCWCEGTEVKTTSIVIYISFNISFLFS